MLRDPTLKLKAKATIQHRPGKPSNNLLARSCNDAVINELKVNNANITSQEEIADVFNGYFVKVDPNLACSMADSDVTFDQLVNPSQSEMFRFKLVSVNSI